MPRNPRTPAAKKTTRVSAAERRRREAQAAEDNPPAPELELKGGVLIAIVPTDNPEVDELRVTPLEGTRPLEVGDLLAKALTIHRRRLDA